MRAHAEAGGVPVTSEVNISALLPHGPSMVLLDAVESWDANGIVCLAMGHAREDNPLRREGILPVYAAIEYAAQAMAVHGALTADGLARPGVLGSVRRFRARVDRLDDVPTPLRVQVSLRQGEPASAIYTFSIRAGDEELASGQAAVFYARGPL